MEQPPFFYQHPHPQQQQPQRQHPQQQQQQPSPPTVLPPPRPARYQRAPQCLIGTTQLPLPGEMVAGSGDDGGQQHMQQQYMPQPQQQQHQQQQQMQPGVVAWQPWGQEGGAERGGPILPASSLRGCYEGKTPIDALHRVASKLGLKVEFFEGDLTSSSDPASLTAPGQRQKGEMVSILAYVDGRPCSYGTAATRGAAKHIASLEALRLLLVPPVHPMPFDESLLIFPSRSGLVDPPPLPPSFPPPALQAPGPQFKPLASPPSLPPRTPTYPQKTPSFHLPSAYPPSSSSPSFVRQGERPQNLMIIEEEGMERERTQGGGWHGQQQQHQQQYQQQQRQQHQQWQQQRQLQQQQQRVLARPPFFPFSPSFPPPARQPQPRFQGGGGGGGGGGAGAGERGRQRVPYTELSTSASTFPSVSPPHSTHQGRAGGGTLGGRGSSSGSTAVLPTPPPSPSVRVPAVSLTPAAVLLENEGKGEEGTPIEWSLGTKAPMLGETFTGGTAEATALLNKLVLVFKSPSTSVKHTEITAPAPSASASSFHRAGSLRPSVLGYVCTVAVRLEGPSLQVATTIRTKAQACSKKESLQLASRAVLAKLFPQATSLRQVEEALAQYQDTKKKREREMAFLNKKAKKLSRQQGINESTQMDVEGRNEALRCTGEVEKEEKGEAMEEGDGDKEGHTTKKARTSSPSPPPSFPSSSSAAPLSTPSALLAPFVKPQPAASASPPPSSLPFPPPTLAIPPATTKVESKTKPTWRSSEQLKGVPKPFLAAPAIPLPSSSSFASSLAAATTTTSKPISSSDTSSKDEEEATAGGSSSGGGLFDGVVARFRGVAGAVGATGDMGVVPLLHSLSQAQCSDFPQYEIIEQSPKGGDEEKMEEGTESDVKESPLSAPVLLGPNTPQAFLGKARFGDSSTGQLIEVSAQGSSKIEVQRLLAVAMLEKLFPGQTLAQVQDHVKRVEETRRAERAAKAQDKFVQLEKKKRLQRALGEPTNALQFQQQEAQARGDQARSLDFIALPAFEVVDTNVKSETKVKAQDLLLQALHDELEEAAKGDEEGQAGMKDGEDGEKYWSNVAAEEKSLILAKQPTALSASRRLLALSSHARCMDAKGLRVATLDDEKEIMRVLKASQEKLTKTVAEEGAFWQQLREEYLVPGAPHTILLLSFPSSLPSSSFTSLCFLHSTVQRRHTTAAGRKEAEAKKRKERDEKLAQAKGKAQAKGEDGDGMIGPKMLRLQGHYVDPAAWDANGDAGLVPCLRGFYRTLFRAARRCGVERCEFWTQRVNDPVVEALEEMDNRRIVGPENNQVLYSAGRTQMRATLAVTEEEGEGGVAEGEGMKL